MIRQTYEDEIVQHHFLYFDKFINHLAMRSLQLMECISSKIHYSMNL